MPASVAALLQPHLEARQQELVWLFAVCFACWNVLNVVSLKLPIPDQHLPRHEMLDLRNRLVSTVHGFFAIILTAYNTFFKAAACGDSNTHFEDLLLVFSLSYFWYDMLSMAYLGIMDRNMFMHHVFSISGITFTVYSSTSGHEVIYGFLATEVSNPAMHLRQILRYLGLRYSKSYEAAEYSFAVSYLIARMGGVTHCIANLWLCPSTNLVVRLAGIGLLVQSWGFSFQIMSIMRQRMVEYAERKRKNIRMKWFTALSKEEIAKVDAYQRKEKKAAA